MGMSWQEQIAGARMTVDKEFASRVTESEFSRQQWGLIMTAIEFEVENPGDPEQARMVADTSKLEHVMPELDAIEGRMSQVPGGGGASGGSAGRGFVDSIKSALGMGGGGGDDQQTAAAEALAQEYAVELQTHLESSGRWQQIREQAARE
jgi:hypothetical protein